MHIRQLGRIPHRDKYFFDLVMDSIYDRIRILKAAGCKSMVFPIWYGCREIHKRVRRKLEDLGYIVTLEYNEFDLNSDRYRISWDTSED